MTGTERPFDDAELSIVLRSIDHRPPSVGADDVMRRVRRRHTWRSALLAASALVSMATIATAAVPGTVLNGFVRGVLGLRETPAVLQMPPSPAAPAQAPKLAAARGVAFVPGERATIVFRASQSSGEVRVSLAEVTTVRITQTTERGDASFDLTTMGVEVGNEGSTASYDVVIPSTLAHVTVRVEGRTIVTKDGAALSCGGRRISGVGCVVSVRGSGI